MMRKFLLFLAFISSVVASGQTRVACVGNSVTYGAGIENRERDNYPAQLQRMLGSEYVVSNYGLSGTTLLKNGHNPYIKTAQYKAALGSASDIVIIHLGLNDTDPRNYARFRDEFKDDYINLIQSFKVANPSARVIIARMTPITHNHPRFKAGTRVWHDAIQVEIEAVAKETGAELIDFNAPLLVRPDLLPDALHPNGEGAQILARTAYSAITGDFGGLQVGPLYGDNMVLQMGAKTPISGSANAGKGVEVNLDGKSYITTADKNGKWSVEVDIPNAKTGLELIIASEGQVKRLKNIAIGQVWILSGQSNMSLQVNACSAPQNARPSDNIRLFKMTPTFEGNKSLDSIELKRVNDLDFIRSSGWQSASGDDLADFSALGYYFGQMVADTLGIPIGLVQTSLGGAPAEAFVSRKRLHDNALLTDILYNPQSNEMIDAWVRSVMAYSLAGSKSNVQRHYFEPAYLYESRILPLSGYGVAGILWYQGESNADNAELHSELFPEVVTSFRDVLGGVQTPFYFVQLADCNRPSWPHFRDTQRELADRTPNCKMVVSMDYGDHNDVHPRRKQPVGERLARLAIDKYRSDISVRYINADSLPLYGKGDWQTNTRYERLPILRKESIRPDLWGLSTHSSGLYIKFITNSKFINATWQTTYSAAMPHMTDNGVKGLDLYRKTSSGWVFVGSSGHNLGWAQLAQRLDGRDEEYMIYLPLYDNLKNLSIGIEASAHFSFDKNPKRDSPMVFYGSSILQGACASRPGMNLTSIISRRLNREAFNFGFSGNARLDMSIAHILASIKNPSIFVLDFVPNCSELMIRDNMVNFVSILRAAHPTTPIVFVEQYSYPLIYSSLDFGAELRGKNEELKRQYDILLRGGDRNIYYVGGERLIGIDGEGTVDGIHATDLGFMRFADILAPMLVKILKTRSAARMAVLL